MTAVRKLAEKRLPTRIIVYLIGLFILATGSSLTIHSDLGVSAVMSLPFVVSLILDVYIGRVVTGIFIVTVFVQILLLRKDFKWINLTQIIFVTIFGYFVDFAVFALGFIPQQPYIGRLAMLVSGAILISVGITFFMEAKLVPLPFEGMVAAFAQVVPTAKFHIWKIILDSAFVAIALILSFMFLRGLYGIREGTIFTAITVGKLMPVARRVFLPIFKGVGISGEGL